MKKIVLLCASGMSTSMLVKKMQEAAKADGYDEHEATAHTKSHDDAHGYGYVHRYPCETVGDGGHHAVKIIAIVLVEE